MTEQNNSNYIFFLKTSKELNGVYFHLSEFLKPFNIVLLPVSMQDLQTIDRHKKHQIIIFRNDLSSSKCFNELRKSYLDFSMSRGHVTIFDISSFSEVENASKYQKSYFYFPLPLDLRQVVSSIVVEYFRTKHEMHDWPGGKRSKLPAVKYESKNK
jgi:hypothetical protein